ncbi:MAG: SH3 domain-containing protein [Gammaproteobacteria bacterium]|nr:SH3 domain-containing protein [Gammaproteobacteria bacterium]
MRVRSAIALLATLVLVAPAYAKRTALQVVVAEPFIEMRTGPGRGYPIFHVADRGATVSVTRRRTDWFEVRTERGVAGWVHADQLALTLGAGGEAVAIREPGWDDYEQRRWEASVAFGDFDGGSSISLTGGYRLSANLSVELMASQLSGDYSDGWLAAARLLHSPFPEWRVAPYFVLGTGVIEVSPRSSLVTTEDRTDQFGQAGAGLRAWLTERFMFRAEYSGIVVFTSRDENEEVDEWKAGFAFFF